MKLLRVYNFSAMKKHVAIFTSDLAEKILTGEKTIESRFSKSKIIPFAQIGAGDIVYIKPSGKDIIGQFEVEKVLFWDGLTAKDVLKIKEEFGQKIAADELFWSQKLDSRYATLIFIRQSARFITSPIKLQKRDQRGWIILD